MKIALLGLAFAASLVASQAQAQFSQINPNGAGGYSINTPGQLPTTITPNGAGGYIASTPGQFSTTFTPNGSGGYNANTPMPMPPIMGPNPLWR